MRWVERWRRAGRMMRMDMALLKAIATVEDDDHAPMLHLIMAVVPVMGMYADEAEVQAALDRLEDRALLVAVPTDAGILYVTTALADRVVR